MHHLNRLPCALSKAVAIVALSKMGVISSIKGRGKKLAHEHSERTVPLYSASQICYSPAHCQYHIDGAVLCHLLGEQTYPFEIVDNSYVY